MRKKTDIGAKLTVVSAEGSRESDVLRNEEMLAGCLISIPQVLHEGLSSVGSLSWRGCCLCMRFSQKANVETRNNVANKTILAYRK